MVDTLTQNKRSPIDRTAKKKFLFDMNIFDEPEEEEVLAEPPPPPAPTFSEAQLEAAKTKAFEEGRQQGIEESLESREEQLAGIMRMISGDTQKLFIAEEEREKLYEAEAVRLTLAIFERLFPLYTAQHGFDELKSVLNDILHRQEGQAEILIETAPSQCEGVEAHIAKLPPLSGKTVFKVAGNESLQEGACKLSWTNGGAVYNSAAMAEEIQTILEETLAVAPTNRHDKSVEIHSDSITPDMPEAQDKGPQE